MKVYLAWSGETSRRLAEAFQNWLPRVMQHVDLFYSPSDIDKGARWSTVISDELETCNAGLLFITPDNLDSRWIHFEAGALSKAVDISRVTPVLFGLDSSKLSFPLAQFQASPFTKTEVLKLLHDYNSLSDAKLDNVVLDDVFDAFWPRLETDITTIMSDVALPNTDLAPSPEAIMAEILDAVRYTAQQVQHISAEQAILRQETDSGFKTGHRVRHNTFGLGVVLNVTGSGLETVIEVVFANHGPKKLALAFAKLVRVHSTLPTGRVVRPVDEDEDVDPFSED